jgi:hypothetical protein
MCPLRRVEDDRAGPTALGFLVPPSRRTFLILRPRALGWDLVLLRSGEGTQFQEMARDEAHAAAMRLYRAVQKWIACGDGGIEEFADPRGSGFLLRVRIADFVFMVCARRPGEPYAPQPFGDLETARTAAGQLSAVLCPAPDLEQECYFNTRHFSP